MKHLGIIYNGAPEDFGLLYSDLRSWKPNHLPKPQPAMYEAIINAGPTAQLIQSPIPSPNANQVVIKVVVSGSNPKDWKLPDLWGSEGINQGDDIAGIVHEVGANVTEFKVCPLRYE